METHYILKKLLSIEEIKGKMVRERSYHGTKLIITQDSEEMGKVAANLILERIKRQPRINLLLPTGTTPEAVYKILAREKREIFPGVCFFNFDEYCSLQEGKLTLISKNHPASYRRYMKEHLFDKISFLASYFPRIENEKSPGSYDQLIKKKGGIDLCLNALGEDGHTFGFNFPGTPFDSRTRLVKIEESTREINQELTGIETPKFALTTGLKTGMESKEVMVIVSGKRKSEILKKVLSSQPTTCLPATILKRHQNCTWVVDEDAASKLFKQPPFPNQNETHLLERQWNKSSTEQGIPRLRASRKSRPALHPRNQSPSGTSGKTAS